MIKFNHFNFNVLILIRAFAFYKEALGLETGMVQGTLLMAPLSWLT